MIGEVKWAISESLRDPRGEHPVERRYGYEWQDCDEGRRQNLAKRRGRLIDVVVAVAFPVV